MLKGFFSKISGSAYEDQQLDEAEDDYVELNEDTSEAEDSKILIRPFVMEDFSDIKPVLDSLREGYTIGLINIQPLKEKDLVELKRAINKLKKTCEAIDGDIAGFGDDYIVVTPSFAHVHRDKEIQSLEE